MVTTWKTVLYAKEKTSYAILAMQEYRSASPVLALTVQTAQHAPGRIHGVVASSATKVSTNLTAPRYAQTHLQLASFKICFSASWACGYFLPASTMFSEELRQET
jgi:hypothetical protein